MVYRSWDSSAVSISRISLGSKTAILVIVLTYVMLSQIWHRTTSPVTRLTNAKPTVVDRPRDSLTAHMMSWPATLVAVVVRRPVAGRRLDALVVNGTKESADVSDMMMV